MTSEARLVERLRTGDSSAFRELVETYKRRLFTLAYDLCGNIHEAEDISQEAFIRVFQGIEKFRGDAKLSSWLYRIVVNLSFDRRRKKSLAAMELRESFEGNEHHPALPTAAAEADPERMTEAGMIRRHLRRALAELSPQQRTIFVLRHDHDMKISDISEVLNLADGTVKSQLFRALQRLQRKLAFYRADFKG